MLDSVEFGDGQFIADVPGIHRRRGLKQHHTDFLWRVGFMFHPFGDDHKFTTIQLQGFVVQLDE